MADARAREFDDATVDCRVSFIRHDMQPTGDAKVTRSGAYLELVCQRCGAERTLVMDARGRIDQNASRYRYPEGYQVEKGSGPIQNSDVRQEWMRRRMNKGKRRLRAVG